MPENAKKVIKFEPDVTQVLTAIKSIDEANARLARSMGQDFSKVGKVIGTSFSAIDTKPILDAEGKLKGFAGATDTLSTKVKLADGTLGTLTEKMRQNADGSKTLSTSFKQVSSSTETFGEGLTRLYKRALITIPVWFLLRNAIFGTARALKQGLKDLASFDKALQKAKRNLQGSTSEIAKNFKTLREEVTKLSLASGIGVEKITNAFQKFATVGFDFETSLAGANVATKLAVTLFGDAEQNANALARAFRVLYDNTTSTKSATEQLEEAGALLNTLWKDQAFEITEIAGAMERFAPVANIASFSMNEMIKVLSALQTAGIRGTRAGRLLSTAVLQLDKNFSKIQRTLGLNINPQLTSTYDRFLLVTKAIGELNKIDSLKASQAVQELFGGVRGGQSVLALVSVGKILDDVLKRTGDVAEFNKEFEEVSETLGVLVDRFHNANREIGKALVTGAVGGEDFVDSLKSIVQGLEKLKGPAQSTGRILASVFKPITTLFDPKNIRLFRDLPVISIISEFGDIIGEEAGKASVVADKAFADVAESMMKSFNKALKDGLSKNELQDLVALLTTFDAEMLGIDVATYEQMAIKTKEILDNWTAINEQQVQSEKSVISEVQREKIAEAIVQHRLDELKAQGALNSQLLKTEQNLRKQLGLTVDNEKSLQNQLATERAIANEKKLQSKLSSNTLKLYEIAKKEGTSVAKKIGDALAGNVEFSTFVRRGGQALEIFKKEFADVFKEQQATAFFKGQRVPGETGLRGGQRIAIDEEAIRKPILRFDPQAQLSQARAEQQLLRGQQAPVATVPVDINVNVDASNLDELGNQVIDKISKQLPQVGTKVNVALGQALSGKQIRTV